MKDKTMTKTLCLALLALLLAGCGKQGPGGEIWKEEVRLMNGDLIVIDRRNVYGSSGDVSASHGPLTEAEIRFDYKGKRYEWKQRAIWPKAIQDDPQGRIYVVSTIPYCWAWDEWGQPDSYYVVHRYESGQWQKVGVTEVDPETVFNLAGTSRPQTSEKFRDFVSEKDWKYKNSDYEPNRHIVPSYKKRFCE
ncbi:MAG: hypothetical protein ACLGH6_05330 [Gammaproteobacteria bacterium]